MNIRTQLNEMETNLLTRLEKTIGKKIPEVSEISDETFGIQIENQVIIGIGLYSQGLDSFPEIILNFSSLKTLNLGRNNLNVIPKTIDRLKSLEILNLAYNQLTSLPASMINLKLLRRLDLRNNNISSLPESITNLQSLRDLNLIENPIANAVQGSEYIQKATSEPDPQKARIFRLITTSFFARISSSANNEEIRNYLSQERQKSSERSIPSVPPSGPPGGPPGGPPRRSMKEKVDKGPKKPSGGSPPKMYKDSGSKEVASLQYTKMKQSLKEENIGELGKKLLDTEAAKKKKRIKGVSSSEQILSGPPESYPSPTSDLQTDKDTQTPSLTDLGDESEEIGTEVKVTKEPKPRLFNKNVAIEYYDAMNPQKNYPIKINIADIEQETIKKKENILTGERKVQIKDKMEVKVSNPIITVRPVFPGCLVAPQKLKTDLRFQEDEVKFYVTPMAKGKLEGIIDFVNDAGKIIYSIKLKMRVLDPRIARSVAIYGSVASVAPKALVTFGITASMFLTNLVAIFGVIVTFFISIFMYKKRQPTLTKKNAHLKEFARSIEQAIEKNQIQ